MFKWKKFLTIFGERLLAGLDGADDLCGGGVDTLGGGGQFAEQFGTAVGLHSRRHEQLSGARRDLLRCHDQLFELSLSNYHIISRLTKKDYYYYTSISQHFIVTTIAPTYAYCRYRKRDIYIMQL